MRLARMVPSFTRTGLQLTQFNNPASTSKSTKGQEMKKQINPSIKAQILRSAFILLALVAVSAIPFALAQRNSVKQTRNPKAQPAFQTINTYTRHPVGGGAGPCDGYGDVRRDGSY